MPILQDPRAWPLNATAEGVQSRIQRQKHRDNPEAILSTQDCKELVHDTSMDDNSADDQVCNRNGSGGPLCTDRAELIERIKRGESPTWVPSQALRQEYLRTNGEPIRRSPPRELKSQRIPLLPAADVENITKIEQTQEQLHSPFEIERPRSALHAGDFTKEGQTHTFNPQKSVQPDASESLWTPNTQLEISPLTPWYRPSQALNTWDTSAPWSLYGASPPRQQHPRDRAPSLSSFSSSSYVLRIPTTPLIQQSNNTDLDFSSRDRSASPEKGNRRHTLPPHALHDWHSASQVPAASPSSQIARSYRRESTFPHTHQPRRSITSHWSLQHPHSPPTPAFLRSRRTSFSSEASPRQRASMVGSYEESILRGRMSTAPSKPFDFIAHIGALGRGKRPKMPAHVTIPFQAVFYDWSSGSSGKITNDEPSPYVGHIDLQNVGKPATSRRPNHEDASNSAGLFDSDAGDTNVDGEVLDNMLEKPIRGKRAHPSAGRYRIPEQGQIQVVVKNPYKTALKLFLVPYDLSGMEAGQKTFVRQRYYSTGPVIEKAVVSANVPILGSSDRQRKPTLRYLIHLNICCPTKGRYYLYQQIRVVFANRVPDDKEHLTKEIQEPKPKYSPWKPNADTVPNSTAGARPTAEKAFRRRSSGFTYGEQSMESHSVRSYTGGSYPYADANAPPVPPIPFHLPPPRHPPVQQHNDHSEDSMDMETSRPTTSSDPMSPLSDKLTRRRALSSSHSRDSDGYTKLNKGDVGYGGVFGRPGTPEPGEGLLAKRLRGLGMQRDVSMEDDIQ